MNFIIAVTLSILLLEKVQSLSHISRIIGGTLVPQSFKDNSYVAIFHRNYNLNIAICSGAIIHYRWILTTASCDRNRDISYKNFRYKIGEEGQLRPSPGDTHYDSGQFINRIYYHPNYVISTGVNDIALFQTVSDMLQQAFTITRTNPSQIYLDVILRAYGPIKKEGKDQNTDKLSEKSSKLESIALCRTLDPGVPIPLNKLCSLDTICMNDQGGPLIEKQSGKLIGIISAPAIRRLTCNGDYTIYTNVFLYRAWIRSITGIND